MKQNRTILGVTALFGFVIGMFIGGLLDQALGATIDPAREGAFRACRYCPDALIPYLGEMVKINVGTIFGAVAGLGVGVLVGWAMMSRVGDEPEATAPRAAARPGGGAGSAADTLIATRSAVTAQTLAGRAGPPGEAPDPQLRQLASLAKADIALHESFDTQTVLKRVHDEALRLSGADFASVILLDWDAPQRGKALRVGTPVDFERFATVEEEVMASNRSRIIADFLNEPERPVKAGVRSSLLAPIAYDERVIGLIGLHSEQPSAFEPDVRDVIEVLAAQASIALGNARRYEEQIQRGEAMRVRVEELQNLLNIAATLQPEQSLASNLESVAFGIQQTLGFNIVVFNILNTKTDQLERVAAAGLSAATFDQLKQQTQSWDTYLPYFRAEFQIGMAYFVPREQAVELFRPFDIFEAAKAAEVPGPDQWRRGDVLLLPIYSSAGSPLGVIYLDDPRDGRKPSRAAIDVLEMFAAPTALAIENARLLASARDRINESQERAAQMEALGESAHVIAGALRPDDVIAAALEQLRRVLPYDRVTLYMKDPADGRFRVTATRGAEGGAAELLDRSLFAEIVANRRALVVADVGADSRFPRSAARAKGSWLGVPLVSRGDVIGLLGLDKLDSNFYLPSHTPVASAFANQVVVALDNARLFEENVARVAEVSERARRLALVNTIATDLIGSPDAERAARLMLKGLVDALAADYGAVLLLDESLSDKATLARLPGEGSQVVSLEGSGADGLVRRVRETLEPVAVRGAGQSETKWLSSGIKQAVAVPMMAHGTLVGVALVGRHSEEAAFTADEIELCRTVAGQGALLAQNARQFQKAQSRLVEVSSLAQASRALIAELDFARLCEVIRTQIAGLTGAQRFVFALYDDTRNELSFPVRGGGAPELAPMAPGAVSQYLIQTRGSILLAGEAEARLRAAGVPDLISRGGAWDAVSGPSYLGVAAAVGNKLVGLIELADERPEAFTETHERLLAALAPQIAAAIENARQHDQIRQASASVRERLTELQARAAQLEALNEASLAVTASLRVDEVIDLIADRLPKVTPCDRLTVWLRDSERGELAVAARRGAGLDVLNTPLFAQAAASRTAVTVPDLSAVPGLPAGARGAWLGAPVVSRGELIGLIGLEKDETGFYDPARAALADAFAAQAAHAIANARQFETGLRRTAELSERASRSALLSRTAGKLGATLDPLALAQIGAVELAGAMQSDVAGVVLLAEGETVVTRHPVSASAPDPDLDAPLIERLRETLMPIILAGPDAAQVEWAGPGLKSAAALPLVVDGVLRGVAVAADRSAKSYSPEALELAQTVTQQVTAALQNAWLYQRTQRRLTELGSLSQVGRAVVGVIDQARLFVMVREQLHSLFNAETICVALYDEARGEVAYPVLEQAGKAVDVKAHGPSGLVGHILRSRQPVLLTGGKEEKQKSPLLVSAASDKTNPVRGKSYLGAPLTVGDSVIGALVVADSKPAAFTAEHERLLVNVAAQVATAIDNARQFEAHARRIGELDRRVQRLTVVNRVAVQLSATLDARRLMLTLAGELMRLFASDRAAVVLLGEAEPLVAVQPDETVVTKPLAFEGDWLTATLRASHQPVTLPAGHEALSQPVHKAWMGGGVQSALALPLTAGGALVGIAAVLSARDTAFGPDETEAAVQLTALAASALRNARQYETTLRRSETLDDQTHRLAILNRASAAMNGTLETAAVLPVALRELTAAVQADRAYGAWLDEAGSLAAQWPEAEAALPPPGDMLVERLRESLSPVALAAGDPKPAWLGQPNASALIAPLIARGKFAGLLAVTVDGSREWRAAEADFAAALAGEAAVALFNAALHERTLKRLVDLGAISQSMRAVAGTAELNRLYEAVRTQVGALVGARDMALALYDESRNEVSFPLAVKAGQRVERQPAAPDAVLWHIIQTQQSLRWSGSADAKARLAAAGNGSSNGLNGSAARSFVGVPLVAGKKTIGVLSVGDDERDDAFNAEHERLLSTLATQVASAIDNVRLYEGAQRRAEELDSRLQRLSRLSRAMADLSRCTDSRQVVATALAQFGSLLKVDRVVAAVPGQALMAQPPLAGANPPDPANPMVVYLQQSHAPVSLTDLRTGSELTEAAAPWLGPEARSAHLLPLETDGSWLGLIALVANEPRQWPPDDLEAAATLAGQVALTLHRVGALERAESRAAELATVNGALRAIQRGGDLPHLWQSLRGQVAAVTQADTMALHLFDEMSGEVATPVCVVRGQAVDVEPRLPGALTRHVILTQKPVLIARELEATAARLGVRSGPDGLHEVIGGESFLAVPLTIEDRVLGVLAVASPQAGAFTERHRLMLNALAGPFAAAIETARTLARTRGELARGQDMIEQSRTAVQDIERRLHSTAGELATLRAEQSRYVRELKLADEELRALRQAAGLPADSGRSHLEAVRLHPAAAPVERPAEADTITQATDVETADAALAASAEVTAPAASEAETTLVAARRPSLVDDSVTAIAREQLRRPQEAEYDEPRPGMSLGTVLLIGLVAVLALGALGAIVLVTTGGLNGLFATQQPTQVVVVTPPPPTPTAGATQSIVISAAATDTAAPLPTDTAAASPTATETLAPTETPTDTPVPTDTPTPGPTLPPGVEALGIIQVQPGTSARLRASPNGDVVGSVPDDTQVQVLQGRDLADGITWVQIRLPTGQVGWIAESLVEIITSP